MNGDTKMAVFRFGKPTNCIVCRERVATVPDRNRWPNMRLRICGECHAARLAGDLRRVIDVEAKRRSAGVSPEPKEPKTS